MSDIVLLDELTINKIAAGADVGNPMSAFSHFYP
jgi:DNA mismatch repair ATPase MutL